MRDPEGVWIFSALRAQENGEWIMELKPVETGMASPISNGEADIAIAGYLAGVLIAGIFLVSDKLRKRMFRRSGARD